MVFIYIYIYIYYISRREERLLKKYKKILKILNLLENASNQPTKFRTKTKNWLEINDDTRGTYNTNSQIKFKTSILKSILCDNSDA